MVRGTDKGLTDQGMPCYDPLECAGVVIKCCSTAILHVVKHSNELQAETPPVTTLGRLAEAHLHGHRCL